jgi:hypothetical protein
LVEHIGAFGELHGKIGDLGVSLSSLPPVSPLHRSPRFARLCPPVSINILYLVAGARADDSPMNKSK